MDGVEYLQSLQELVNRLGQYPDEREVTDSLGNVWTKSKGEDDDCDPDWWDCDNGQIMVRLTKVYNWMTDPEEEGGWIGLELKPHTNESGN